MSRSHQIYFPMAALLIASLACAMPAATAVPDTTGVLNTAVAQTVIAALTLNAPVATLSPTLEPMAVSTFTPEPPTLTPTETVTATLVFTSTPLVTLISVSVPTNCRNGPGKVYVMTGALLVGEYAEVFGRNPTNNYWYIRNPDSISEFCWVWGEYATLTGPTLQLPVYTPPPTPTATLTPLPTLTPTPSPSFKADYASLESCTGSWWVDIKLKNNGTISFKSVFISVKDMVTSVVQVQINDDFTDKNGCLETITRDKLAAGDTYLLSAPAFNYNPTGHKIEVTITLCSDTGQKGLCITRKMDFIP